MDVGTVKCSPKRGACARNVQVLQRIVQVVQIICIRSEEFGEGTCRMSKGASKVGRAIDWDYLIKVVTTVDGKRDLQSLRRAYDDVAATIQAKFSVRPQGINWDFYREKLGPGIVNIFENSINSLDKEVPDYECEFTEDYKANHRALLNKASEKEADSKKKILAIDKELKRLGDEKEAMATMTVDEYYSKHPDVGAKIDDEIRNQIWG